MKDATYTQKITLGSKTYFFDVRGGKNSNKNLPPKKFDIDL